MSLWELRVCVDGWRRANGAEDAAPAPSVDEHLDRVARLRKRRGE